MFSSRQLLKRARLQQNGNIQKIIRASICHKSELPPQKGRRWPYETTSYGFLNFYLDPFTRRKFTENTKLIQIEGNVAAGKEDVGRRLADELGMKYMPNVDLESYYINDHGFDYRALNPLLPERLRLCDWEMFHENPTRHSVIHMQNYLYKLRVFQYLEALRHMFNTGQGVIVSRSPFTEKVFVDAMHKLGWLPMGYLRDDGARFYDWRLRYDYIRNLVGYLLYKPHLTIYLDTPVDVCLDRIRKSEDPVIANSKALVPDFLQAIKEAYEDDILSRCDYFGLILNYEYPERASDAEIMDMVDDIKTLDFEYDIHDTKFTDWNYKPHKGWHTFRRRDLTTISGLKQFTKFYNQPWEDIAGLGDSITQADLKLREALFEGHAGSVGKFISLSTDSRFNNPLKVLLDYSNFGQRVNQLLRGDFV